MKVLGRHKKKIVSDLGVLIKFRRSELRFVGISLHDNRHLLDRFEVKVLLNSVEAVQGKSAN